MITIKENNSIWNASKDGVDFRKITTPSTTRVVMFSYDMRYPTYDNPPEQYKDTFFKKFECDNVEEYYYQNATKEKYLEVLQSCLNSHFSVIYLFGHGIKSSDGTFRIMMYNSESNKSNPESTKLYTDDIWNVLKNAKNRHILFFDNCYSGSLLKAANVTDEDQSDDNSNIANYIIGKFEEQDQNWENSKTLKASSYTSGPMIDIWCSAPSYTTTWYVPGSYTVFLEELARLWNNYARGITENDKSKLKVTKTTRYGQLKEKTDFYFQNYVANDNDPVYKTYGDSTDNNVIWK